MAVEGRKRLTYLDALRGVAAVSVVIYHYVLDQVDQGTLHGAQLKFADWVGGTLDLGKYGVVLFFLISGYIIPNSLGATEDRIGRFCISRFFRLYPLYWLALAIGIFLPWPPLTSPLRWQAIVANVTMIQGYLGQHDIVGPAWTLQIELTFYGCCVVLASMRKMASPRACAAASVGFLVIALLLAVARSVLVVKLPTAIPLALSVMFFGTLWREATLVGRQQAKDLVRWLLPVIVVMIVPISVIGYNHDFGYHEHWQSYVACYLLAILTFVVFTTRILMTWRPLVWLGQISYSLYLLHPLVAAAAYRSGISSSTLPLAPLAYCVVLAAFAVLCAWLTYHAVEQPFVQVGRRLIQRTKVGTARELKYQSSVP